MLRVALTGGVGSGKSAAARMLRGLGAFVSQSDEVARGMMQPGYPVFLSIRNHFGPGVVSPNGELDRSILADLAFEQGRLEELNAIVHPAVIAAQTLWMDGIGAQHPGAVAVVESALVLETKHGAPPQGNGAPDVAASPWRARFDRVVVITAPVELRRARYIQRLSTPAAAADFDRRAASQWSDRQKAALADFELANLGSLEDLQDRIGALYLELRREAADAGDEAM